MMLLSYPESYFIGDIKSEIKSYVAQNGCCSGQRCF